MALRLLITLIGATGCSLGRSSSFDCRCSVMPPSMARPADDFASPTGSSRRAPCTNLSGTPLQFLEHVLEDSNDLLRCRRGSGAPADVRCSQDRSGVPQRVEVSELLLRRL